MSRYDADTWRSSAPNGIHIVLPIRSLNLTVVLNDSGRRIQQPGASYTCRVSPNSLPDDRALNSKLMGIADFVYCGARI